MAFDFPTSPTNGQTYTLNGVIYTWNGSAWVGGNPSAPAFSVHRNGTNQTSIPAGGVATKILWTTEEYDVGGYFASSRYTPQVPGIYQINGAALMALVIDSVTAQVEIRKNGVAHRYGSAVPGGYVGNPQSVVAALVSFNGTTDWIELWVNHDDTVVRDLYGAANTTYFQGVWLRPLP